MRTDLLRLAAEWSERGLPFVHATVIRREPPSSAQVGDQALVTPDGAFHGWLGGSCIRPTVVKEALAALHDGRPRLVALSPTPDRDQRAGVTPVLMTCYSGGSVDVYLEPVLPAPKLLVFGIAPVARAVARMGTVMGYAVAVIDPDADENDFPGVQCVAADMRSRDLAAFVKAGGNQIFAVVATMGEHDEQSLRESMSLNLAYLGIVASRKRFTQVREVLLGQGVPAEDLDRVHCPAGLDIGATSPEEIALSIHAQIVQERAAAPVPVAKPAVPSAKEDKSLNTIDPVCGMAVHPTTAQYHATVGNQTYYFCCGGCREQFIAAPRQFLTADSQ